VVHLTWRNGLGAAETAEIRQFLDVVEAADGMAAVGEHVILRLKARRSVVDQIEPVQADVSSEHFIVRDAGGTLVGYAHLDTEGADAGGPLVAELAVHPRHRRQGIGARLVEALLERAQPPAGGGATTSRLRIWSHGEHPAAVRLAQRYGLGRVRELWRMGRELAGADLPEPVLTEGVTIRAFRVGADETPVVRVNRRAFSWHPEQGAMTESDLRAKQQEDWFDPAGFLIAVDPTDEIVGFHWTKVHPDGTGEVYVLGVDPDTHGKGLGTALTLAGLRHLRDVGCAAVILYVEADNPAAIKVYQRLGFQHQTTDVQFGR
jgi:mycothiol synthase